MSPEQGAGGWALVTGASSGIGRVLALELAGRGFDLILTARSAGRLHELAADLERRLGRRARVVPADLEDPETPLRLHEATEGSGLEVDVLVNNAGLGAYGPFLDARPERNAAILRVNAEALTALAWLFGRSMRERGRGRILNVASTAAFQPGPLAAVYYASKAYVLSFSEALGEELRGTGVTVTALCPGTTASDFHRRAGISATGPFGRPPAPAERVARKGVDALLAGRRTAIPGLVDRTVARLVGFVPRALLLPLVHRVQQGRG